ncbi:hypothetical protein [Tenacibaculum piscium]|uniref:hypothetical protein n=1 Tax=Tenacibaculum piscium TaxID=1458515 RepID=UPI00187BA25C|nr:hypothetical protein [Tenacibaculum piscium]MBE7630507.1 hypothetical protein [Tenacibaculum piscium]MCD8425014.1 hypothetical protein [Tenacibaculum dicentrarchi]
MKEEVKYKLNKIADVWNYFIWEYDFCKRKIKFTTEIRTNYFGDILGYFQDTFDIIFDNKESKSHSERFSNQISLLQSIYVQQDFVEELLLIFKCGISKGDLKKDLNYSINRDIRNELVGHPIRKQNGEFISSCLFGYNGGKNKVTYLRYHKDNNYKFESMEFPISEIIERHKDFLNKYFDKILNKLKRILSDFSKEIENIENLIDKKSFDEILTISKVFYESIFKYDFIYDKESLQTIYAKKDDHKRYQNLIDKFYYDLKSSLKEKREFAIELFEPKKEFKTTNLGIPPININFEIATKKGTIEKERPVTYHYELGKIATKRTPMDFEFFGGCLKDKCSENEIVLTELKHMESNIYNDIEYYSAYRLICNELKEE